MVIFDLLYYQGLPYKHSSCYQFKTYMVLPQDTHIYVPFYVMVSSAGSFVFHYGCFKTNPCFCSSENPHTRGTCGESNISCKGYFGNSSCTLHLWPPFPLEITSFCITPIFVFVFTSYLPQHQTKDCVMKNHKNNVLEILTISFKASLLSLHL